MDLRVNRVVLLGIALCLTQAQMAESQGASPDPWFAPGRSRDFETFRGPKDSFAIELPKGWLIVPGYGGIVFMATEKPRSNQSQAAVVLEKMQLRTPIDSDDVNATLADIEASLVRPYGGQNFEQQVKEAEGGRRFILIQYSKPGVKGLDRVIQYSIPAGAVMYRLICIAPEALLAKMFQPMFAHVAQSFKASPE